MKQARVQSGQTWADLAVQHFGTLEAVVELAMTNVASLSDDPAPGQLIWLPDRVWDAPQQSYCKKHGVQPATARDESGERPSVFAEEFNDIYL